MSPVLLFFTILTSLLWVGAILLWVQVYRAPENVSIRFFAATLSLMALNFLINILPGPASATGLLLINLIAVATGFTKIGFFLSLQHGRYAGRLILRDLLIAVSTITIAVIAWVAAPAELRAVLPGREAANQPAGFIFSISMVGYLTYVSARTLIWTRLFVPQTQRRALRISLIIIGAGAAAHLIVSFSSIYSAIQLFSAIIPPLPWGGFSSILPIFTGCGFACLLLGAAIPVVDGAIREVPRMKSQRNQSRALEPLSLALKLEFPQLALPLRSRSASHLLYRQIIEIRDGLVLLSPYYDSSVVEEALETSSTEPEDQQRLTVRAALIIGALAAHRTNRLAERPYSLPGIAAVGDWLSDATDLVLLSRQFSALGESAHERNERPS